MRKFNPDNERMKRKYLHHVKEIKGKSEKSLDPLLAAIARYEKYIDYKPFKAFNTEKVIAFKRALEKEKNPKTGEPLSMSTLSSILRNLKDFFLWLSEQPGYKSRINTSDAHYFNPSNHMAAVAHAQREPHYPTEEQALAAFRGMPHQTELEKRDRAIFACILLTGARDSAVASLQMKHVDMVEGYVYQDAREVRTKRSKTFRTSFFPMPDDVRECLQEWVDYLRVEKLFGANDPLFPRTKIAVGSARRFEAVGIDTTPWNTTATIRKIVKDAFSKAGMEPFPPHSIRHTIAKMGERMNLTLEQMKAWSLNLGHTNLATTANAYGHMGWERQAELIKRMGKKEDKTA